MGGLLDQFLVHGVRFETAADGNVRAFGTLSDKLRTAIRAEKPTIIAELLALKNANSSEGSHTEEVALFTEGGALRNYAVANDEPHWRWRITPTDRPALEVRSVPDVPAEQVQELYPGATIERLLHINRKATEAEACELHRLVAFVTADWPEDQPAEALAAALNDPEAALTSYRLLAADATERKRHQHQSRST